ncbi:MAG: hypothetical protein KA244_05400 [Deltaproteobacteria bacterium]|jgi:hypothetical protein|nr:hypothetical protein [Deltaproteobacteria bacterium]
MPFAWLHQPSSTTPKSTQSATSVAMRRAELIERASLLRRLGYSRDEALRRCQAYEHWEHEPFHTSPLSKTVQALVDEVYAPRLARVGTLTPESQ